MQEQWNLFHKRLQNRFRPAPLSATHAGLADWFDGCLGQYLLGKEKEMIQALPDLAGYHMMELGVSPEVGLLEEFDNLHRFTLNPAMSGTMGGAVADFDALPLPSDIIDTVVIHHALEFSPRPHTVLNEVARVVMPGGHLVLFVLNPFSLMGMAKWPAWLAGKGQIWQYHSLRLGRLVDWLRLLHFHSIHISRGGFGARKGESPPENLCERWGYGLGMPAGMFYTIVARKHVARPIMNRGELWNGLKVPNLGWQQRAPQHRTPPCVVERATIERS